MVLGTQAGDEVMWGVEDERNPNIALVLGMGDLARTRCAQQSTCRDELTACGVWDGVCFSERWVLWWAPVLVLVYMRFARDVPRMQSRVGLRRRRW